MNNDPNDTKNPNTVSQNSGGGAADLPDLKALQSEINQVADKIEGSESGGAKIEPGLSAGEGVSQTVNPVNLDPQKVASQPTATPLGTNPIPPSQGSVAGSPPVRMAPGEAAGILPKSEITNPVEISASDNVNKTSESSETPSVFNSAVTDVGSAVADKQRQQGVGPLGFMGSNQPTTPPGSSVEQSSMAGNVGSVGVPQGTTQNPTLAGGAVPPLPTPPTSIPPMKDKGEEKPKGGIGKKLLGIVLGLLLIGGIAGGAYYYYTTQVQVPQIAEVGSVCSSEPPTAPICYGVAPGTVVQECWKGFGNNDPNDDMNLVCETTTGDLCAANEVSAPGACGSGDPSQPPGGGGQCSSLPNGASCNNGGTYNGQCVRIYCPEGCGDTTCDESDPGAWWEFGPCDDFGNFGNNVCGQVDFVDSNNNYCASGNCTYKEKQCVASCVNTPGDPGGGDPSPSPSVSPSPGNTNPTCSSFNISDTTIDVGDTITITAAGADPGGQVTHIDFYWTKTGNNYCASNPNPWTLIEDVNGSSATVQWDTSDLAGQVSSGESVQVAANVHDNLGGWCTGNPGGTCGLNISACPNCGGVITINDIVASTHTAVAYCEGDQPKVKMEWDESTTDGLVADISLEPDFSPRWKKVLLDGEQVATAEDEFVDDVTGVPMPPLQGGSIYYTRLFIPEGAFTDTVSVTTPDCGGGSNTIACIDLSLAEGLPVVGETVTLTCTAESPFSNNLAYDFRYSINQGNFNPINSIGDTASLEIEEPGEYIVQCRACVEIGDATVCDPIWSEVGL